MSKYRIEIIANQSVQEDITELLELEIPEIEYTVIPTVHGRGRRTKKLGTSTWPEQNFVLFSYLDMTGAQTRWEEWATNPGSITTDAIVESYAEAENIAALQPNPDKPEKYMKNAQSMVSYRKNEGGYCCGSHYRKICI